MKNRLSFWSICLILVLSNWLQVGCHTGSNEAAPQGTCRIQEYVSTSGSTGATTVNKTNYVYDSQGNLSKTVTTLDKRSTGGNNDAQTGTTTAVYTYDTEGYLTKMVSQETRTNIFAGKTTSEQVSINSSYTYTNGRLSTVNTRTIGAYGVNTTTTESYVYDGAGDLTKKIAMSTYDYDPAVATEIPTGSTENQQIWTYQKNQLVDYVIKSGTSESRPLTIVNGLVTAFSTTGNLKTNWAYDSQQRQLKIDEFVSDTLTRTTSQTWSDAKPAINSLPTFKGFPLPVPTTEFGQAGVLSTSTYSSWNKVSRKMEQYSQQTATILTNSQGFITNATISVNYPAAASQGYTTTETYTYSGCQ